MRKKLKNEWIAALRSGEYKQAKNVLHSADGGFCCIGVLADIGLEFDWEQDSPKDNWGVDGGCVSMLFDTQLDLLGLGVEVARELAGMNDSGNTFNEIADWIEENL